jgi:ABC-2 type transport system permease protein
MRAIWTITKQEFGAYFKSPVAYIFIVIFLLASGGLFFIQKLFTVGTASLEDFFGMMPFLFLVLGPAIAMGLVAEERRTGTIEMLLTMPVRDSQVLVGKYLAAMGVVVVGLLFTLPYPITVAFLGPVDKGPVIAGYLGTILLGATYVAVGLFTSTTTKSQVVAFVVGFAICFTLVLSGMFVSSINPELGVILSYLSPQAHFSKIARGVVELRDVVYYLTIIGVMLTISLQVMEARKWR